MTPSLVTLDKDAQSVEATGHPSDCTEPVPGPVQGSEPHSVTVKNAAGDEKPFATYDNATLHFDTHSHEYSDNDDDGSKECHDDASHDLTASGGDLNKSNWSSSVSITPAGGNDTPVLVKNDNVATDPKTGSPVNATGTGINNSVSDS
jgi:hypothetical protein